jgi:hypothetical protein
MGIGICSRLIFATRLLACGSCKSYFESTDGTFDWPRLRNHFRGGAALWFGALQGALGKSHLFWPWAGLKCRL